MVGAFLAFLPLIYGKDCRSKDHSENLSLKLLRDVVFLSLAGQLDIP